MPFRGLLRQAVRQRSVVNLAAQGMQKHHQILLLLRAQVEWFHVRRQIRVLHTATDVELDDRFQCLYFPSISLSMPNVGEW